MSWKVEDKSLVKEFAFTNFSAAIKFINEIHPIAEKLGHHPNLLLHSYNKVKVILFTHSEDKITEKDHLLAEQIDAL